MTTSLFVYGTLLGGAPQGALLARHERQPASLRGRLYHLPAGYPALDAQPQAGDPAVHGELVMRVDEARLRLIDRYEGVDEGLYRRVERDVDLGLRRIRAWVYVMDHPERRGGRLLTDGRWRRVRAR